MSFNIPNLVKEYIYVVKNPQGIDISASVKEWASGSLSGVNYKILEYHSAHTFHIDTDYAQLVTMDELQISLLSGAFWDLVGELNNPATHMQAHAKYRPFSENDQTFCFWLLDDLNVHLRYVIAGGTTAAQRHTMYNNTLQPLIIDLSSGALESAADFLGGLTGAALSAATGVGTSAQWDQLLTHVNMMAGPFLQKFPR